MQPDHTTPANQQQLPEQSQQDPSPSGEQSQQAPSQPGEQSHRGLSQFGERSEPNGTVPNGAPPAASPTYARNHDTLLTVLRGGRHGSAASAPDARLTLGLERVLVDHDTGDLVPFEGETGLEALLAQLASDWGGLVPERQDGRLVGLAGVARTARGARLDVAVSLAAGGQVACEVGPSSAVCDLLGGLEEFDRRLHVAARELGRDYLLLSEGYNPLVSSPLDVPLVPQTRWTLLNAFLSQTGRHARDMMRCACATRVSLALNGEDESIEALRLGTALAPVLMFLTDNVRSFRGSGARRCPRMVRSLMWEEVDPARCGVVPGTFDQGFSYERYLEWLEGLLPILFVDAQGTTTSTGKRTMRELLEERPLTAGEAHALLDVALPYVRLGRTVELMAADALRPRMAAGYAAFVKGLFGTALSRGAARSLLGSVGEQDVVLAAHELRMHGWDAVVYGQETGALVDQLLQIARTALDDADERSVLDNVAEQWEVRMVPRDAFVAQETKAERGW